MMQGNGDLYRQMLAAASHSQQQRHAILHQGDGRHTVGNVFLPALQNRSGAQSALSMKHLQVIEQCIVAENRREEQLAKCGSEKERRYLVKKFQAQRAHERDLIQALMIGHPTNEELTIVDTDTAKTFYKSPLGEPVSPSAKRAISPDKLFAMKGERTFATTSPTKRSTGSACSPRLEELATPKPLCEEPPAILPQCTPSPKKKPRDKPRSSSPTRKSETTSSSSSPTKQEKQPTSPTKGTKHKRETKLPHALASSPLKASVRPQESKETRSPSPTKRKKPSKSTRTIELCHTPPSHSFTIDEATEPITFDGMTSFEDVKQHAMAIVREREGRVDGDTQTTARALSPPNHDKHRLVLMLTTETQAEDSSNAGSFNGATRRRPHSSPEPRRRRPSAEAHMLPSLGHSDSLGGFELFHKVDTPTTSDSTSGGVHTYVSQATAKSIHVMRVEKVPEMLEQQLAWNKSEELVVVQDEEPQPTVSWDESREQYAEEGEQSCYYTDDQSYMELAHESEEFLHEDLDGIVLSTIYDIVHHVEEELAHETHAHLELVDIENTAPLEPEPEARRAQLVAFGKLVTRIQASFRGHRARRVFRLALYQEALQCGVLGAMPGTLQGRSGWYQDPKTFLAYYFAVSPDGEWKQKVVLRCTGLILTHYQMHEHILSRVDSVGDDS